MVFRAAIKACPLGLLASSLSFAFAFGLQDAFLHEGQQESGRVDLIALLHRSLIDVHILLSILLFSVGNLDDLFQGRDFAWTLRIIL